MSISLIAAMSENRVIGMDGHLPWDIPAEYQHYLARVRGGMVIMGRRSFEVFGSDLQSSRVIVLSRENESELGVKTAPGLEEALTLAARQELPVYIAGGASVYAASIDIADEILLSVIRGEFEGDAFFPRIDPRKWQLTNSQEYSAFTFQEWRRR